MRDDDLIERYLEELDAQLRLPRRARRRIIAEANDHLRELVGGTGEDDAAAQSQAIVAFGAPVLVAARFAYELAIGAARRAARTGTAMFMLALVLWDLCTSTFIHVAPAWVNDGPGSALLWIIGQVGLVAGVTSLARARIASRADAADTVRLRYVVRGLLVVSICTGLTVAIAVAGVLSSTLTRSAEPNSPAPLAGLTLACAVVTAISAGATWRARRRLASFDDSPMTSTGREPLADVLMTACDGLACAARHLGLTNAPERGLPPRSTRWQRRLAPVDPQHHPWRYGGLIALLAGTAVPALNLAVLILAGELDGPQLGQLASSAPALITIEAALVLIGYATLGRYLGLRPTSR